MSFKTPTFWYRDKNAPPALAELLLMPVSCIYQCASALRTKLVTPYNSKLPVICVGNITAGGSGKTPVAIALYEHIAQSKLAKNPVFLTRGYGGKLSGVIVDPSIHSAADVGDEALLLQRYAPVIVAHDRAKGAKIAEDYGADLIIMDDGLQNPGLHKDLRIQVIDSKKGYGNERVIPAGPLRNNIKKSLECTDLFILIGNTNSRFDTSRFDNKKTTYGKLIPNQRPETGLKYIAFAGIAHPDKFFDFLTHELNLTILKTVPFADHHPYSEAEITALIKEAQEQNATVITTEKDAVKIPAHLREHIKILPVKLELSPGDILDQALKTAIESKAVA